MYDYSQLRDPWVLLQAASNHPLITIQLSFSSPSLFLSSADSTYMAPMSRPCRKRAGHHARRPGITGAQARLFIHSLVFLEHLSPARHCSRLWSIAVNRTDCPGEWTF